MTLEEAQKQVDQWVKTYGVRYFSELTNMAVLTEEVGELARVMARKYGDQSFKEGEKDNIEEDKMPPAEMSVDKSYDQTLSLADQGFLHVETAYYFRFGFIAVSDFGFVFRDTVVRAVCRGIGIF